MGKLDLWKLKNMLSADKLAGGAGKAIGYTGGMAGALGKRGGKAIKANPKTSAALAAILGYGAGEMDGEEEEDEDEDDLMSSLGF